MPVDDRRPAVLRERPPRPHRDEPERVEDRIERQADADERGDVEEQRVRDADVTNEPRRLAYEELRARTRISHVRHASCPPSRTVGQFYHTPRRQRAVLPVLRRLPVDAARVPAHEAVLRDDRRDALEELAVGVAERGRHVGVDVDLGDHEVVVDDRDDDLGPGREEAREVALVGVHVVHDLGLAARGRGAAHALADGDPDMLGGLGPLPGTEHELVSLDEVDPDPRVGLDAVCEQIDDAAQDLVGRLVAAGDALDLGQHVGGHDSAPGRTRGPRPASRRRREPAAVP